MISSCYLGYASAFMKMDVITSIKDPRLAECLALRSRVFTGEQNVPVERDRDGLDVTATHYLFIEGADVIGTARSREEESVVKIERFALLPTWRGSGRGAKAFTDIVTYCRETWPDKKIVIGAQNYLRNFYEKIGFKSEGAIFMDAGIEHVKMIYQD